MLMLCRDLPAARVVREEILAQVPGAAIHAIYCDLASFASVRACARSVRGAVDQISMLINNAGAVSTGHRMSIDGFELTFATNHLGPFLLTSLLTDRMTITGRIINVASTDAKRYRDASVSIAYAISKHALLALSHAAKFAGWDEGVRVTALCPGAVDTELVASVAGVTPSANRLKPKTIADIVALLLSLPNAASISELVVNTRLESTL